jgi:hypothetical protein
VNRTAKKLCKATCVVLFVVLPLFVFTSSQQARALAGKPFNSPASLARSTPVRAAPASNTTTPSGAGKTDVQPEDYPPGIQPPDLSPKNAEKAKSPFDPSYVKDIDTNADNGSWTDWLPWNASKTIGKKITGWIWNAVNACILKATQSAFKTVMVFVGKLVFNDINFKTESKVLPLYTRLSWIVGGIFALLVILVALKTIIGASFNWSNYRVKVLLPRMCLAAFCAIFALPICQLFINAAHSASMTILSMPDAKYNLIQDLGSELAGGGGSLHLVTLMFAWFVVLGFAVLGVFYMIRKVALIFLAITAPLAFTLWIDESTSSYTILWAKTFFALVFIEVIHAILSVLMFNFAFSKGDAFANILYCFGVLFLFWKIPALIFQSTVINWRPSMPSAREGLMVAKVSGAV